MSEQAGKYYPKRCEKSPLGGLQEIFRSALWNRLRAFRQATVNPIRRWGGIALTLGCAGWLLGSSGCRQSVGLEGTSVPSVPPKVEQPSPPPAIKSPPRPEPAVGQTIFLEDGAVSLCLPNGWKRTAAAPPLLLRMEAAEPGPGLTPSLFLMGSRVPGLNGDPPLDEIEAALKTALPAQAVDQKLKIVSTGRLILGKRQAVTVVATLTLAETPAQQKQYFLYAGDRQYVLTGLAPVDRYRKLEPLFDGVAASFQTH